MTLSFKTSRFLTTSFTAITLMMGATYDAHASGFNDPEVGPSSSSSTSGLNSGVKDMDIVASSSESIENPLKRQREIEGDEEEGKKDAKKAKLLTSENFLSETDAQNIAEVEAIFAKRSSRIAEKAAANLSVKIAPGHIPSNEEAARIDAINHNANSPAASLLGMPNEILMEMLLSLDPASLAAAAQTSRIFAELIATPYFQRHYCPLTANEYDALVGQLPELFGEEIGGRLQKFLLDKPMNAYWRDLAGLIDPENLALLQAKKGALLRRFFTIKIKDEDGDWSPLPLAKALTISSYAKGIFTANMNGYIQQMKICALAPLSTDQIAAVSAHHNQLISVTIIEDYFQDTVIKTSMIRDRSHALISAGKSWSAWAATAAI